MRASGSAQGNFGPMHLRQIRMLQPDISILKEHAKVYEPLFTLRQFQLGEIDCLGGLRDVLLPRLLSGEIEVSNPSVTEEAVNV